VLVYIRGVFSYQVVTNGGHVYPNTQLSHVLYLPIRIIFELCEFLFPHYTLLSGNPRKEVDNKLIIIKKIQGIGCTN
jgi:hypothetical protein